MKKPIYSKEELRDFINPELEIAKLKFMREIEKSNFGKFIKYTSEILEPKNQE